MYVCMYVNWLLSTHTLAPLPENRWKFSDTQPSRLYVQFTHWCRFVDGKK